MGSKILVAEDEPYILESLNFLLRRDVHEVISVTDGGSVMEMVEKTTPDLLILDVMLPTINGFDVVRKIRGHSVQSTLPILTLTAKGQESDRKKMLEIGANDFVTKPFSNQDLLGRVQTLLNAARGSTSSTSQSSLENE